MFEPNCTQRTEIRTLFEFHINHSCITIYYFPNSCFQTFFLFLSDMADSVVKFDKNGDGIARYIIYNYQKRTPDGASTDYKMIGRWMGGSGLDLDVEDVIFSSNDLSSTTTEPTTTSTTETSVSDTTLPSVDNVLEEVFSVKRHIPQSVCSLPCKKGYAKIMNTVRNIF